MTSPLHLVARAYQVCKATLFLMNRTEPSSITTLTPPEWFELAPMTVWSVLGLSPEPNQQALVFGETPVNPGACKYMNKMKKGSCAGYHLNEPKSYYNTIKFWKTPIPQCGNGKNDCMDYTKWQQAWTQLKG